MISEKHARETLASILPESLDSTTSEYIISTIVEYINEDASTFSQVIEDTIKPLLVIIYFQLEGN